MLTVIDNPDPDQWSLIMMIMTMFIAHRPFSWKMAAWPGPMNRPSFFNTKDPPNNRVVAYKRWSFMMVIFVYYDHCRHLRWSSPPPPYPDKARTWTCSSRRGSRKWSRSPCNNRTSSRTRSTSPDSFLFLHIVLDLTRSFLIFIWSILTLFNAKKYTILALVG